MRTSGRETHHVCHQQRGKCHWSSKYLTGTIRAPWCQESEQMCERGWSNITILSFHRKMPSNGGLHVNIWTRKHVWVGCWGTFKAKVLERLGTVLPRILGIIQLDFGVAILMLMQCVSTVISNCELWGNVSPALNEGRGATGAHAMAQLWGSQQLKGQGGHIELGTITASFILYTVCTQQAYYLLHILFVKVIFSKSRAQRHTSRAAVSPVNPLGRKSQALFKWNRIDVCFLGPESHLLSPSHPVGEVGCAPSSPFWPPLRDRHLVWRNVQ